VYEGFINYNNAQRCAQFKFGSLYIILLVVSHLSWNPDYYVVWSLDGAITVNYWVKPSIGSRL
jgi:hypothetical protein